MITTDTVGCPADKPGEPEEIDIWRDTPVRLLGYSNEVGESFRALVPVNVVRFTYGVAFAYVFADTRHKTLQVADKDKRKMVTAAADTLLWQTLASIAIPGYTINRICALSLFLLGKNKGLSLPMRKWTTTAIGLASIPFIVKPIDHFVDYFMDRTFRTYFPADKSKKVLRCNFIMAAPCWKDVEFQRGGCVACTLDNRTPCFCDLHFGAQECDCVETANFKCIY